LEEESRRAPRSLGKKAFEKKIRNPGRRRRRKKGKVSVEKRKEGCGEKEPVGPDDVVLGIRRGGKDKLASQKGCER